MLKIITLALFLCAPFSFIYAESGCPNEALRVDKDVVVFDFARRPWLEEPSVKISAPVEVRTPDGESVIRVEAAPGSTTSYLRGLAFPTEKLRSINQEWESLSVWIKADDSGAKINVNFCSLGSKIANVTVPLIGRDWQRLEFDRMTWSNSGDRIRISQLSDVLMAIPGASRRGFSFCMGPISFRLKTGAVRLDPLPVLDIPLAGAPRLDGRINDACWSGSVPVTSFIDVKTGMRTDAGSAEVRLVHDEKNLYVAARQKIDPSKLVRQKGGKNSNIFTDDCLCLFVSPVNDGRTYYQFIVNSLGVTQGTRHYFNQVNDSFVFELRWDGDWQAAAATDGEGWSAELKIPFNCMTPELDASMIAGLQIGFSNPSLGGRASSWSMVNSSFLEPEQFGVANLIGGKKPLPDGPFRVDLVLGAENRSPIFTIVPPMDAKVEKFQLSIANPQGNRASIAASADLFRAEIAVPEYMPASGRQRVTFAASDAAGNRRVQAFLSSPISFSRKTSLDQDVLCPRPKSMRLGGGRWEPGEGCRVVISSDAGPAAQRVAERLRRDLDGYLFVDVSVARDAIPSHCIIVTSSAVPGRLFSAAPSLPQAGSGGYVLNIAADGVVLAGVDDVGLNHAALTLAQLERYAFLRCQTYLSAMEIRDWPSLPDRVIMQWNQGLTSRNCQVSPEEVRAWHYKVLDRYLVDVKMNAYSLTALDAILYDDQRNRRVSFYPKGTFFNMDDIRRLKSYCDESFVEFIPGFNGPSHALWVTIPYPQLIMPGYSNWDADPMHSEFFPIYFGVVDELISATSPRRVCIWQDEWWHRPQGAISSQRGGVELRDIFRATVERIHGYFAERGIDSLMFSDMLLKQHNGGAPYDNYLNARILPRDITMMHWSSPKAAAREFSSLGYDKNWLITNRFAPHGLRPGEIDALRIRGCGVMTYSSMTPDAGYGYASNLRAADYAWNAGVDDESSLDDWLLSRGRNILSNSSVLRNHAAFHAFRVVDLSKSFNSKGSFISGWNGDVSMVGDFVTGVPVKFGTGGKFPDCVTPRAANGNPAGFDVGFRASSLIFLHSQYLPKEKMREFISEKNAYDWFDGIRIGFYRIEYADGTFEIVGIRSGENIGNFFPYPGARGPSALENTYLADCRSTLELSNGACLYQYEWINPNPGKVIARVAVLSSNQPAEPVLFAVTARGLRDGR